jgi:hypothetical protein
LTKKGFFYLKTFSFWANKIFEEVVKHGGDPVYHGWVKKDGPNFAGQLVQYLDRLQAHDVVVPSKPTRMLILKSETILLEKYVIFLGVFFYAANRRHRNKNNNIKSFAFYLIFIGCSFVLRQLLPACLLLLELLNLLHVAQSLILKKGNKTLFKSTKVKKIMLI